MCLLASFAAALALQSGACPQAEAALDRLAGSPEESRLAAKSLQSMGDCVVPGLARRLTTCDSTLRWRLVNLAGVIGSPRILPDLVEAAVRFQEPHARWRAYWAIAAVDDGTAVDYLKTVLQSSSPERRWRAAVALAFLRDQRAVPVLHEALRSPLRWKRWEAAFGLAQSRHDESWRFLTHTLLNDPEPSVRQEAAMSLWKLGRPESIPALMRAAREASPAIRWRALCAAAALQPQRIDDFRRLVQEDPSPQVEEAFNQCQPKP